MAGPDTLEQHRQETLAALDRLLGEHRIDPGEHERRTEVARRALDETELATVRPAGGAPVPARSPSPAPAAAAAAQPARPAYADPEEKGYIVAVMSGSTRKGPWEPPEKLQVFACMGGVELDFREAALLEGTTDVDVFALMGGINITVPDDIDVEVNGFGLMGGFDHVSKHGVEPGRPLLRIRGIAIMGGVAVKVKPLAGESTGSKIAKRKH